MLFNDKIQTNNIYLLDIFCYCMHIIMGVNEIVDVFVLYTLPLMPQVRVSITIFAYFKYILAVWAVKLRM